jgi:RNA polymerase sigma-70 factor (ECF subfamily)
MDQRSDEALAAEVARGDAEALRCLFMRYQVPAFNLILRLTGDREMARDLLQEAFTRVWTMADTFDPGRGEFKGWLFTIALNAARSELAKKRHGVSHVEPDEASLVSEAEGPEALLARSEDEKRVAGALGRLTPLLREVVVMKVFHQLKFREIAQVTHTPEGTLKARFHRAVAELRGHLGGPRGDRE